MPRVYIIRQGYYGFTQGICDEGECLVNGICMECGLAPGRTKPPPHDPLHGVKQIGGCAPLCGTPPKCYPCGTGPTYPDRPGAKMGQGPNCPPGYCDDGHECYWCGDDHIGPGTPKQQPKCVSDADCGPGCFCKGGQCYCGQPQARLGRIRR